MTLKELEIGKSARITAVGGTGALRQHLLDMGVIPGVVVTAVKRAPMGDPIEIKIHGYELTLRLDDAAAIAVEPAEGKNEKETQQKKRKKRGRSSEKEEEKKRKKGGFLREKGRSSLRIQIF